MLNFTGSGCPYCEHKFKEGDDIVVCPTCGTPHHRECYNERGRCANEARHAEGFVWSPDPDAVIASGGSQGCPECGHLNADGATQCARCGRALGGNAGLLAAPEHAREGGEFVDYTGRPSGGTGDALERALWPYSFEDIKADDRIDGFTVRDWAGYIARSVGYYIYCFKTQDKRKRKTAFTWSAMMFAPVYFLYRRVWWASAAAFLANIALGMPAFVVAAQSSFFGLTLEQWSGAEPVTSLILLAVNVLWGVFAAWIYRKNSVRVMNRIRALHPDDEGFHNALQRVSGPSLVAAIAIPLALALILSIAAVSLGIEITSPAVSFFGGLG